MNGKLLSHGLVLAVGVAAGLLAARPWRGVPAADKSTHAATGGVVAVATEPSRKSALKAPGRDADGEIRLYSAAEALAALELAARERNWDKRSEAMRKIIKGISERDYAAVLAGIEKFKERRDRQPVRSMLLTRWADFDPLGVS